MVFIFCRSWTPCKIWRKLLPRKKCMYPCIYSIFQILGRSEYHSVPSTTSRGVLEIPVNYLWTKVWFPLQFWLFSVDPFGDRVLPSTASSDPLTTSYLVNFSPACADSFVCMPLPLLHLLPGTPLPLCTSRSYYCTESGVLFILSRKGWWSEMAKFWKCSPKVPVSGYSIKYRSTSCCAGTLQLKLKLLMSLP